MKSGSALLYVWKNEYVTLDSHGPVRSHAYSSRSAAISPVVAVLAPAKRLRGRVVARLRHHRHVAVVEEAHPDVGVEAPLRIPRGGQRVADALGRAGEGGAGLQPESGVHLRHRLLRKPQDRERQPRVEPHQLLDVRVLRGLGPERPERALVVLLTVADQPDVVADAFGLGPLVEHLGQRALGLVVALEGEIGHAQEEQDRQVARRERPGLLQHLHRLLGLLLGHQDQAAVVERLHVLGVQGQRVLQQGQRLVVLPGIIGQDGLRDEHVGLGLLGHRRRHHRPRQEAGVCQAEGRAPSPPPGTRGASVIGAISGRGAARSGRHVSRYLPRRAPESPIFQTCAKNLVRGASSVR